MSAEIIKISEYKINSIIAKCEQQLEYLERSGLMSKSQKERFLKRLDTIPGEEYEKGIAV